MLHVLSWSMLRSPFAAAAAAADSVSEHCPWMTRSYVTRRFYCNTAAAWCTFCCCTPSCIVVLHLIWWWHPISRRPVVTPLTVRSNIDADKDCWLYNGFAGNITVYLLRNAVQHRFLHLHVEIARAISSWTMPMLQVRWDYWRTAQQLQLKLLFYTVLANQYKLILMQWSPLFVSMELATAKCRSLNWLCCLS